MRIHVHRVMIYRHNFEMENETATLHAVAQAAHFINNSVPIFSTDLCGSFDNISSIFDQFSPASAKV